MNKSYSFEIRSCQRSCISSGGPHIVAHGTLHFCVNEHRFMMPTGCCFYICGAIFSLVCVCSHLCSSNTFLVGAVELSYNFWVWQWQDNGLRFCTWPSSQDAELLNISKGVDVWRPLDHQNRAYEYSQIPSLMTQLADSKGSSIAYAELGLSGHCH